MNTDITHKIRPESFRLFLQDELVKRCRLNSSYSLRAFARDLEIDNSVLSKIISGKRPIGKRVIRNLIQRFDMNQRLLDLLVSGQETINELHFEKLAIDTFEIISDWHHYAILELMNVKEFKSDAKWMAKRLGMKVFECEAAIERLKRVEMIEEDSDGELVDISGGKSTNISSDMNYSALRKMQKQLLEKSIKSIDEVPYEKRSNTSITLAIDTERLPEAMEEINKFRRNMAKLLSKGKQKDEVYNLSIALCPLTNIH